MSRSRVLHHGVSLQSDDDFPFMTAQHPFTPGSLWGSIRRPYPTGAWWTNLALGEGDSPVVPLPYTIKSTDGGVGVSYSAMRRKVASRRVQDEYATDLQVTAVEGVIGHHIVRCVTGTYCRTGCVVRVPMAASKWYIPYSAHTVERKCVDTRTGQTADNVSSVASLVDSTQAKNRNTDVFAAKGTVNCIVQLEVRVLRCCGRSYFGLLYGASSRPP